MTQTYYFMTELVVPVQQVHLTLHVLGKAEAGDQRQPVTTRISQLYPAAIRFKNNGQSIQCCTQKLFGFTTEGQRLTDFTDYGKNFPVLNLINLIYSISRMSII